MKDIVVFTNGSESYNPIRSLFLKKGFKHCFACINDDGVWLKVDSKFGRPTVQYLTIASSVNLVEHYRDQNLIVVELDKINIIDEFQFPFVFRSCVSFIKAVLGIKSLSITPYNLYRYLQKRNK